jgi:glycosyltransferase involved in cell wall biosynthesis
VTERFCAAIPALNAARTLPAVLRAVRKQVETVVVVDDGSSDETSRVASEGGATVLRHDVNRGKGAALKTAFAWALERGFDGVITLDADGQHLPAEIAKLVGARHGTGADLIIGGRSHLFAQMLPRRRNANRFSAWSIAKAAGTNVTDSQSGFRLYSRRLLERVKLRSDGFAMESEVIVRSGRSGFHIITIPIELGFVDGLATSHYKPVKDTLRIAWTVLKALIFR